MALDFESDPAQELKFYTEDDVGINVEGVFVDCPTTAVNVFVPKGKCRSRRWCRKCVGFCTEKLVQQLCLP